MQQTRDELVQLLYDAVPERYFGDVLSADDGYVERPVPEGFELTPQRPYDQEPWRRPWHLA